MGTSRRAGAGRGTQGPASLSSALRAELPGEEGQMYRISIDIQALQSGRGVYIMMRSLGERFQLCLWMP
jgi:hypothetical protein